MIDFTTATIRLAGVVPESVVDGTGIRFTVFTQGCPHACKGCHNPDTHDFSGGTVFPVAEIAERYRKNPLLDGVTFSGGEPFSQAAACAELAKTIHAAGGNIWTYTGYIYEQLLARAQTDAGVKEFLDQTDVLADGPFIEEQKDLTLKFRGSKNQRLINLKAMREQGTPDIILAE